VSPLLNKPEFDNYAQSYDAALNEGLALSGESKSYFAEGRVHWLARCLAQREFDPASVLDFGCGTGTSTPFLLDILGAKSVVGLDVSPSSVEIAARTHGAKNTRFALCSEYEANGEIDLAFTNGVFHHIPPADRPAALRQVNAALRPGGLLAFWENNPWSPGTRWIMSRIPFDRDAVLVWPQGARRLLRQAGFNILLTHFAFIFPGFLRRLRWLEPHVRKLALGGQYLVLARKDGTA